MPRNDKYLWYFANPLALPRVETVYYNMKTMQETTIYINGLQGEKATKVQKNKLLNQLILQEWKKVKNLKASRNGEVDIIPEKLCSAPLAFYYHQKTPEKHLSPSILSLNIVLGRHKVRYLSLSHSLFYNAVQVQDGGLIDSTGTQHLALLKALAGFLCSFTGFV